MGIYGDEHHHLNIESSLMSEQEGHTMSIHSNEENENEFYNDQPIY